MNKRQCLLINSAVLRQLTSTIGSCFLMLLLFLNFPQRSYCLRLTNMSAPHVADLRDGITLDCHFNMGIEKLYAVKWYKDDQEFFRYMPEQKPNTMSFPVAGVHLVLSATSCSKDHCKVRLQSLTRDHSGGAYRCEISSEAPAFRLASETHNVTVAALPRENPKIEGLTGSYVVGNIVEVKCISDRADPAPTLSWYINGNQAPERTVGEMISSEHDENGLVSRSLNLQFLIEQKYIRQNRIEISCKSSLPGIPVDPQITTHNITLGRVNVQNANNQMLSAVASSTVKIQVPIWLILFISVVRWSIESIQDNIN